MKVSKAQAQENRALIVRTASTLFRERGYDGVGVADLMAAAGFTHGGFYKHFGSKANLMAEAAMAGIQQTAMVNEGIPAADRIRQYLSREHRDTPGTGCTFAALSGDASRQTAAVKAQFAQGIEAALQEAISAHPKADEEALRRARHRRLVVMAQMVGALVLSRACPDDSSLSDEILDVCREALLKPVP